MDKFGPQPWIDQVMSAVQHAVQNGIELLSRPAVTMNAHPADPYRFGARTASELKESAHLVPSANAADLPPPEQELGVEVPGAMVRQPDGTRKFVPNTPPPKAKPKQPEGWIL